MDRRNFITGTSLGAVSLALPKLVLAEEDPIHRALVKCHASLTFKVSPSSGAMVLEQGRNNEVCLSKLRDLPENTLFRYDIKQGMFHRDPAFRDYLRSTDLVRETTFDGIEGALQSIFSGYLGEPFNYKKAEHEAFWWSNRGHDLSREWCTLIYYLPPVLAEKNGGLTRGYSAWPDPRTEALAAHLVRVHPEKDHKVRILLDRKDPFSSYFDMTSRSPTQLKQGLSRMRLGSVLEPASDIRKAIARVNNFYGRPVCDDLSKISPTFNIGPVAHVRLVHQGILPPDDFDTIHWV